MYHHQTLTVNPFSLDAVPEKVITPIVNNKFNTAFMVHIMIHVKERDISSISWAAWNYRKSLLEARLQSYGYSMLRLKMWKMGKNMHMALTF